MQETLEGILELRSGLSGSVKRNTLVMIKLIPLNMYEGVLVGLLLNHLKINFLKILNNLKKEQVNGRYFRGISEKVVDYYFFMKHQRTFKIICQHSRSCKFSVIQQVCSMGSGFKSPRSRIFLFEYFVDFLGLLPDCNSIHLCKNRQLVN